MHVCFILLFKQYVMFLVTLCLRSESYIVCKACDASKVGKHLVNFGCIVCWTVDEIAWNAIFTSLCMMLPLSYEYLILCLMFLSIPNAVYFSLTVSHHSNRVFLEGTGCICFLCNYFKEHVYILKEEGREEISNAEHFSIWLCNLLKSWQELILMMHLKLNLLISLSRTIREVHQKKTSLL